MLRDSQLQKPEGSPRSRSGGSLFVLSVPMSHLSSLTRVGFLVVCRRNGCRVSPALDVLGCVLRLGAVQTAAALCVLATNVDASATPSHHFSDRPLALVLPDRLVEDVDASVQIIL
jgi:hypothetical protein